MTVCVCVFSLLLQQSPDLLQRAVRCPGFLHTAVLCYISLLQLFLEGHTPTPTAEPSEKQVTEPQVMVCTVFSHWTALNPVTLNTEFKYLYCQLEPSQILSDAKQFLLRVISQTSPTALSSSQRRQVTNAHKHTCISPHCQKTFTHLSPPSVLITCPSPVSVCGCPGPVGVPVCRP